LVFLFNPNKAAATTSFSLTRDCLGLASPGRYRLSQHYPAEGQNCVAEYGQTLEWTVPAETVVIIDIGRT
jgi:hypothetical protein